MKKYTYLISNDAQTLTRVGEPMAVRGDSGVAEVEFIIPSGFVINPTKALWRAYYRLPGKRKAPFITLPTPTATESGDWTTTWTVTHAVTKSAGRLAFSLTAFSGEAVQWNSRVAIFQINESVFEGESEESEEPYIGRLTTLEGDMAQIRGEWEGVQDEFDDLKETATLGTPIPESLVANMTEGHVYIYTGTEPGYTAGHVYYYVDGVLKDGGVYGGTAVDATLTQSGQAADAKVTGDEIAAIKEDLYALDNKVLSDDIKNALITCLGDVVMKSDSGATAYNTLRSLLMDESWDYEWTYSDGLPDANGMSATVNNGTVTMTETGLKVDTANSSTSSVIYKYSGLEDVKSKAIAEITFVVNSFTSQTGGGVRLMAALGGIGLSAKIVATILFTQNGIRYLKGSTWETLNTTTYTTNTEYTLRVVQTENTADVYVNGVRAGTLNQNQFEERAGYPQFTAHRGVSATYKSFKLKTIA
jgi:hypothetical protein